MSTDQTSATELFNPTFSITDESQYRVFYEQYRLYIEMMDRLSERRNSANTFFLTLNTGVLAVMTGFLSLEGRIVPTNWLVILAVAGVILGLMWARIVRSYDQLNTGKFKVIHMLETQLPARLYATEWSILGQGDGRLYKPLSHVERHVPHVFILFYICVAVLLFLGILG